MQEYNICYSLDSNYAEQLAVSIASIIKNADIDDNINFHILDGGLSIDDKKKIELLKNIKEFNINYISVSNDDFKTCPLLAEKDEQYKDYHVTLPTYYRFKLAEFLPNIDKVLYLDCDVIIRTSLKDLFEISLDGYSTGMVIDADASREEERLSLKQYFNAGVMFINLDYWRKNNIENKLFEFAKNNQENILWQDQDIVNIVLKDEIKEIDKKWNYQYFQYEEFNNDELANSSILHIAGRFKPWLMPFESNIYDEYYYYLSFTAWKNNAIKYKQNSYGKHLKNQIGGRVTNILVNATDEDIQEVYKDVAKNYDEVKILYDDIAKSNEFTKELDKEARYLLGKEIDEKTTNLYDEIAKSYEYIKELDKEARYLLEKSTDEKIDLVYQEITNNYKYTEKLIDEVKNEINKNNNYTEYLVEILENKQNQKLQEELSSIHNEISQKDEEINSKLDEKIKILEEVFSENTINIKTDIAKDITHQFREFYSYSNEHFSRLYKGLKDTTLNLEVIMNDKVKNLYQNDNDFRWEIDNIKANLAPCYEVTKEVSVLKQELSNQNNENNKKLNELKKEYENQLNQQRIKYEKKLMKLENIIKEERKNPIVRLIEKIKKR